MTAYAPLLIYKPFLNGSQPDTNAAVACCDVDGERGAVGGVARVLLYSCYCWGITYITKCKNLSICDQNLDAHNIADILENEKTEI